MLIAVPLHLPWPGAVTLIAKCLIDKDSRADPSVSLCHSATEKIQRKYSPFVNKILKFRTKDTIGQFWRWL